MPRVARVMMRMTIHYDCNDCIQLVCQLRHPCNGIWRQTNLTKQLMKTWREILLFFTAALKWNCGACKQDFHIGWSTKKNRWIERGRKIASDNNRNASTQTDTNRNGSLKAKKVNNRYEAARKYLNHPMSRQPKHIEIRTTFWLCSRYIFVRNICIWNRFVSETSFPLTSILWTHAPFHCRGDFASLFWILRFFSVSLVCSWSVYFFDFENDIEWEIFWCFENKNSFSLARRPARCVQNVSCVVLCIST